jgi:hypothetical protein
MTPNEAVDHLMAKHALSREQACGVIGALMVMPDPLRPWAPANSGMFQQGGRYELLWDWSSSNGGRDHAAETQLDFLMNELHTGFARLGAKLAAATTTAEAVRPVTQYCHPTGHHTPSRDDYPMRLHAAEELLNGAENGKRDQTTPA